MIKKIAWDAFKNTGDVNTFLELKQIQSIEKEILEQNATKKYEDELWSEQTEEQSGNNKNDWNNTIGEQFRRL